MLIPVWGFVSIRIRINLDLYQFGSSPVSSRLAASKGSTQFNLLGEYFKFLRVQQVVRTSDIVLVRNQLILEKNSIISCCVKKYK